MKQPSEIIPLSEIGTIDNQLDQYEHSRQPVAVLDVATLGIPVGTDIERIRFHRGNAEKAANRIGTMLLHISGYHGDKDEVVLSGSIGQDGSLASAHARTITASKINTSRWTADVALFDTESRVELNIHARNADMDISQQYDATLQAAALQSQTQLVLMQLTKETNVGRDDFFTLKDMSLFADAGTIINTLLATYMVYSEEPPIMQAITMAGASLPALTNAYRLYLSSIFNYDPKPHFSYFSHTKADRILRSALYIKTHKFFSAV